jgi:hypothetical protein
MIQSALPLADVPMPEFAPFVAMAFLGTGLVLFIGAVGAAISLAFRHRRIAGWIGAGAGLVAFGYAGMLVGASLLSRDRTLARGEKKYFCEIDCHLAYSVTDVQRVGSGQYVAVTLRTWFDPNTIAPWRGDAPLSPNARVVYALDRAGRRSDPSPAGQRAWEAEHGPAVPLTKPLRPGESYATTLVFEAPAGPEGLRLFVGDPPGVEALLIGHENSPLHGRIYLALGAAGA